MVIFHKSFRIKLHLKTKCQIYRYMIIPLIIKVMTRVEYQYSQNKHEQMFNHITLIFQNQNHKFLKYHF